MDQQTLAFIVYGALMYVVGAMAAIESRRGDE
jgi:hypothetical protein